MQPETPEQQLAMKPSPPAEKPRASWPPWLAWLPIPAFLIAVAVLLALHITTIFEPPGVQATLSTLFCTAVSLLIVLLAAQSYRSSGLRALLWLGCGALAFGTSFLLTNLLSSRVSVSVIVGNSVNCLAGCYFLLGAVALLTKTPKKSAAHWFLPSCLLVLFIIGLLFCGACSGIIPPFYIPGHGMTPLRQLVVFITCIEFLLASAGFALFAAKSAAPFHHWCAIGLALIGLGIGTVILAHAPGTPISWLGRAEQYTGGLYLFIAVFSVAKNDWLLPLQRALRQSEERYHALFNHMSEGFAIREIITDAAGKVIDYRFVDANPAFEQIIGFQRDELVGKTMKELMPGIPAQWIETFSQVAVDGKAVHIENFSNNITDKYSDIFSYQYAPNQFATIFMDVTARKLAEEKSRQSERHIAEIIESINDGFFAVDKDWRLTYVNQRAAVNLGMTPDDMVGKIIWEAFPHLPGTLQETQYRKAMTERSPHVFELEGILTPRWYEIRCYPTEDGLSVFSIDITERKRNEQALRESERRERERAEELAVLFESVPTPVVIVHDSAGEHMTGNRVADELLRLNRGTELSLSAPDESKPSHFRTMKDGRELRLEELPAQRAARGENVKDFEFDIVFDDGMVRHLLGYGTPLLDEQGRPRGAVHTLVDITERKQAEEALHELNQRLTYHVDNSPLAVIEWGPDMRLIRWSVEAERIFGWAAEEVLGKRMEDFNWIYQEDEEQVADVSNDLQTGTNPRRFSANRNYRKDGSVVHCEWYNSSLVDAQGKLRSILSLVLDVTERWRAEEALRESERRVTEIIESISDFFYTVDRDWRFIYANRRIAENIGVSPESLIGKNLWETFPETVGTELETHLRKAMTERVMVEFEAPGILTPRWFNLHLYPCVEGLSVYSAEITERKQAEEELRRKEIDLTEAQRIAHIGNWYWDAQSDVTTGSNELLRIYGFDPATQHMPDFRAQRGVLYPPEEWERVNAAVQQTLETEVGYELDVRAFCNGAPIWITTRSEIVRDTQGNIVGLRGTVHDISERKRAEEALHTSLREKEVLLKEIHHRVKNNMQIISSLVSLQADNLDDPLLRSQFNDFRDRVRTMALVHEKLYQSESLERVDFAEYANSLLNFLMHAHRNPTASIRFKLDLQPVSFSIETAVPCGLLLNELVTNALKHAFRDRAEGEVSVALCAGADGRVCLRVSDNGAGLPAGVEWRNSTSLGLQLVQMLAGQLNGTLEVTVDDGTTFTLSFTPRR